ncbi:MAG: SusC/RagA family TonB-linked outer membrane protein [Cytophagales bacterium]|jgi:TonB-linked SusC/RagA family outer membrane protein|nr:SusC/RagA family TonB-linked outer membrane protein [Bacteroidota bacterium]MBS1982384.1 SusC/RagA family TonB-linked outer membrane protein [Bacteroidota bacterium]WHZ06684.1 MAG: SusC/RagA family TonB-linked outer membrane protein [Cytophagales bacterium]
MVKNLQIKIATILMFLTSIAIAQTRTVTGRVTSAEDGSQMPGVNVLIKGTTTGTTSDSDGNYKLSIPDEGGTIVFSFIGYANQEQEIGARTVIDVSLAPDATQLSEVVVTALGLQSEKRSLGTSVAVVKAEDIENTRQTNFLNAFTGKVAGVRVQSSNGMVGSSTSMFIRGFTSFNSSNQPLFVVDGIPIDNSGGTNSLQTGVSNSNRGIDINPDDIESQTILKGPAAAVLYGSRAAAGAVIITTKKGSMSKNKKNIIEYTSNYNVTQVNRLPSLQNTYAQGDNGIYNPLSLNSWGPKITGQDSVTNYLGKRELLKAYPNNVKDIFRQGSNVQNSINFKGGNEKSNYIFSYSNLREDGILKNNTLTRNTFKVAANTNLTEKLSAGASFTYFNTISQRTPIGNQQANPLFRGYFLPRSYNLANYPYQNPNGTQTYFDPSTDNPLWTIQNNTYNDRVDRMLANFNVGYDITHWLNINYKLGTDAYLMNVKAVDAVGGTGNGYTASGGTGGTQDENYYSQQTSSYLNITAKKTFGDFNGSFLLGNEINQSYARDQGTVATQAAISGFGQVTSYSTYQPFNSLSKRRLVGVYAQATVGYKEFAYLTVTGRNDWSSTFPTNNNSYFYPSIAGSLIFTDLFPAIKSNGILSFGKLRGNIATVGREAPLYATDTYFVQSNPSNGFGPQLQYPFRGQQGYTLSNNAGNPNLKPEFTTTREVGTELHFLNDRLVLDVGYFSTRSTDIILSSNAPVSAATGYSNQIRNAGELKTDGWEVTFNYTPIKTSSGFSWNISANWTHIDNNVVKIDPLVTSIFLGGFTVPQTQLQAGKPYGVIVGNPFNRDAKGNLLITSAGAAAGQVSTNTATVSVIGNPNPKWFAGLTNTLRYRDFSLSFLLDFRKGGDIISRNIRDVRFRGVAAETGDRDRTYIVKGVLRDPVNNPDGSARALMDANGNPIPNNIALNAQQYWTSLYNTQGEGIVFDGSWIRLRELSVSYSLPKKWLSKSPFGAASIVLTGRNLWLYAPNYPHFDPEVNTQGVSNSQGFEFNTLPQTRTYGAVLRLTF